MLVKNVKITDLIPYENNPRNNDNAVEYVANSIKEFGFQVPIVIYKDNVIVAGHTRYKAAKKLKLKNVPVVIADNLTPEQIKAFRIADNKTAEKAEWDITKLAEEIKALDIDLLAFGFEEHELDVICNADEYIDDFFDDVTVQPVKGSDDGLTQIIIKCDATTQENIESVLKENNINYVIK